MSQLSPWRGARPRSPSRPPCPSLGAPPHPSRLHQPRRGRQDRPNTTAGQCAQARKKHSEGKTGLGHPHQEVLETSMHSISNSHSTNTLITSTVKGQWASTAAGHKHCLFGWQDIPPTLAAHCYRSPKSPLASQVTESKIHLLLQYPFSYCRSTETLKEITAACQQ